MVRSRLDLAAATFNRKTEELHTKFLAISSDPTCAECQSAGFGEAILVAWLQEAWIEFTRKLIVASALGTRRRRGTTFRAIPGVKSEADAERIVKVAASCTAFKRGTVYPVWHAPHFAIEVGSLIGLRNLPNLEFALGSTIVPEQITAFRNYLVHPSEKTRKKYEGLQAKLGHHLEPEILLHQRQGPGLTVFTSWIRELERIANNSTQ